MNKFTFKNPFQVETGANPEIKKLLVSLVKIHNPRISFNCIGDYFNEFEFLQFWVKDGNIIDITHDTISYHGILHGLKLDKDLSIENAVLLLTTGKIPYTPVKIKLNKEHTAEILENGDVKVGCQVFPSGKIKELAREIEKVQNLNK